MAPMQVIWLFLVKTYIAFVRHFVAPLLSRPSPSHSIGVLMSHVARRLPIYNIAIEYIL